MPVDKENTGLFWQRSCQLKLLLKDMVDEFGAEAFEDMLIAMQSVVLDKAIEAKGKNAKHHKAWLKMYDRLGIVQGNIRKQRVFDFSPEGGT